MAEYIYEGLFILNSNRYGRDPEGVAGSVQALIEKQEGTVLVSRLWEERRLAYSINGQRKGTYWLTYFRMDGEKITDLNQQAHREDDLLRHLVIRIDPRIADTLISHAQQTVRQSTGGAAEKASHRTEGKQGNTADVSVATVEAERPVALPWRPDRGILGRGTFVHLTCVGGEDNGKLQSRRFSREPDKGS